jgi:ParB family transcriptional regulator, chromosome partitioning protein
MSRKQADYLNDILGDETGAPSPAGAPARGLTLLSRESALAKVASGDVRQVTQLLLDPARVRVWSGNARVYAHLTEDNCRDLIDSILAEGGQKVPAIVRRVADDPAYDYEVIAGTRRHFAVSWLRANNYPTVQFVAQVQALDDEAAFRLADLENRARRDVNDLERARNYLAALDSHYGGHQGRMAERLRLSKGWLSKMLTVARLPGGVVVAFASPDDVQLKACYPLAQAHQKDEAIAARIEAEAARMVSEGLKLPMAEVVRRLLAAAEGKAEATTGPLYAARSRYDRPLLSVQSVNRQGITIRLHNGSGADEAEALEQVRAALAYLAGQGKGLVQ